MSRENERILKELHRFLNQGKGKIKIPSADDSCYKLLFVDYLYTLRKLFCWSSKTVTNIAGATI